MQDKKAQLAQAYRIIARASMEEKRELFARQLDRLDAIKSDLTNCSALNPASFMSLRASDCVSRLFFSLTGYKAAWVFEEVATHCGNKAGRKQRYDYEQTIRNCVFIHLLKQRDCPKTQAIKLLQRLTGDFTMLKTHFSSLNNTYLEFARDYTPPSKRADELLNHQESIIQFLELQPIERALISNEKTSKKATLAFTKLCEDILSLMREACAATLAQENDNYFETRFAPYLKWIQKNYQDPIEHFYKLNGISDTHLAKKAEFIFYILSAEKNQQH